MKKKSKSKSRRITKKSKSKSRRRITKKSKSKSRRKNSDGMDGIPQLFLSELVPRGGDLTPAQKFEDTLIILNALDFTNKMTIENFTTIINDVYSNKKYLFIIDHNRDHDEDNTVNDFYKVHKDLEPTFFCLIDRFAVTFKLENHRNITHRYSRIFEYTSYNLLENGNHVIKRIVEEAGPPAGAILDDDEEM